MLTTAKPILEQELYKVAYDAYMAQFTSNADAKKYANEANNEMKKFADKFAKKLSSGMADAIYKFVKEIGINITIPPTVLAPPGAVGGPCTGVITPTNVSVL